MKQELFQNRKQSSSISAKMQQISRLLLTTPNRSPYSDLVVAKSTTSRRKAAYSKGEQHAKRAFFVRSERTPKENALGVLLSMVGRKGQPLAVGCFPFETVFLPLYALPPAVGKLAESLDKYQKETAKMLFKFLLLGDKRLTVRIRAKSEAEARQRLNLSKSTAICVARLNGGIYA